MIVEERKKTMRHFYRTCIVNEKLMKKDENKNLILGPVEPVPERDYGTCESVY